jgi:hypothetical protein
MRVFDFTCANGHTHEKFVNDAETREVVCDTCGEPAHRELCAPRCQLDAISGDFPGASIAWENKHKQKLSQEKKSKQNHGDYGAGYSNYKGKR